MMKRFLLLFVLLLSYTLSKAQVSSYSFSTSTGVALTTGSFTNLLGTFLDDDVSANTNIGFTFNYNNVNYTQFSVTSNGMLALGESAITDYNNVFSNVLGPYIIPYWDDNYTDADGNVQYLINGAVGSRKLVVEYNLSYLGNTGAADKKFQIWLFETSNIIQFVYGAGNDFNGGFSVGIVTSPSDFNSITVTTNTSSNVTPNDNNTIWPGSGRTYIFNPISSVTPLSSTQNQTDVSCFGGSNGSATVTPSGGTSPYTYDWTPGNPTGDGTGSVSGLTAGTWTCTVTDAANLTLSVPITITQPTAISVTPSSQTNVACFGGSTGAASINAPTGGAGGYTYNWTPGNPTGDGTLNVTDLTAGTWTCTVTDANSCTSETNFTITQLSALTASSSATNISCFGGTATVTVSATGGTTPYSGTGNFTENAGTLAYTVTDALGCTSNTTIVLSQPALVDAPTGNASQTFCSTLNATIASIQVSGTGIQWYASNSGGSVLATTTPLVSGTTYYATQTISGCESPDYLAVTVTITVASTYYADADGDGYGAGTATNACAQPVGFVTTNTDCNDTDASVNPAASEICNSIDDDCDTQIDEGLLFTDYYLDSDGDGFGTSASANLTLLINENFDNITTSLSSGWSQQNLSSPIGSTTYFQGDPGPFTSHSGAANSYLAVNFNSGAGTAVISNWFISPEVNLVNGGQFSFWTRTTTPGSVVYPDRLQIRMSAAGSSLNVGLSQTSFGDFSALLLDINPIYTTTGFPSAWTYYTVTISGITAPTTGRFAFRYFVENGGILGANSDYIGIDDVSYTVPANVVSTCNGAPVGYVSSNTDCNDSNSAVNAGAIEICNSIDDDCDTQIDEGVQNNFYVDTDGDGYGAGAATAACTAPTGYVTTSTDCDNTNAAVNPAATEICNSIDDDCDTQIDEGLTFANYYADVDGDGFGAGTATNACAQPVGFVTTNTDCDNTNAAVNPGATEVCNSIDDDCDTQIDEGVGSMYYADADGDGYGTGTATIACTAPVGMVANNTDCNDNSSAVNPGANETCNFIDDDCDGTADDGVPVINYYSDLDGDTFGGTLITSTCAALTGNFVVIGGDCNDANIAVNPGAVEICLNSIDDDCDGNINDGCLPDQLAGESPATSQYVWTNFYPTCVTQSHTLAGFAPSLSSQSICLTGEDKWHYFTATSEAVSIVVASSANDILLELQNASGTLIATENAVAGIGGEILNFSGLVSGQVYKVGVRNYNSILGIGAYTLCVKMLKRGGCDYGPGPYSLCQYFKASFAGAGAVYTFTFTGLTGNAAGNVYTRTQSSDICVLSNVSPSLPYGSTYNVLITSTYNLQDAAGNTEIIAVPALSPCTMSTVAQPTTSLRTADQCVNGAKFRGAIVASLPWVCGVTNWRWEFTEVNPLTLTTVGLPIALNRGAASNFINLGTVSALQNGKTYAVRTAPILASTGSNYQWGPTYYMCIIGSAGMVLEDNNATSQNIKTDIANEVNMSLYPNPTHGTDVNINLSGVESDNVQIRIVDAMGRQVWSNRFVVNGVLNTNITFEQPLANGLYFVEAIFNGELQTQRMMVQK